MFGEIYGRDFFRGIIREVSIGSLERFLRRYHEAISAGSVGRILGGISRAFSK